MNEVVELVGTEGDWSVFKQSDGTYLVVRRMDPTDFRDAGGVKFHFDRDAVFPTSVAVGTDGGTYFEYPAETQFTHDEENGGFMVKPSIK